MTSRNMIKILGLLTLCSSFSPVINAGPLEILRACYQQADRETYRWGKYTTERNRQGAASCAAQANLTCYEHYTYNVRNMPQAIENYRNRLYAACRKKIYFSDARVIKGLPRRDMYIKNPPRVTRQRSKRRYKHISPKYSRK